MKLISHRGNIYRSIPERENTPEYIQEALDLGYEVEVDVWLEEDGDLYLGHDYGKHRIDISYLINDKLWVHAKTIDTLHHLLQNRFIHCFFHDRDDCTLTSRNYIWTFPGRLILSNSICVLPEKITGYRPTKCAGICSDYIFNYKYEFSNSNIGIA